MPGFLEDAWGFCSCSASSILPRPSFSPHQGHLCSQWAGGRRTSEGEDTSSPQPIFSLTSFEGSSFSPALGLSPCNSDYLEMGWSFQEHWMQWQGSSQVLDLHTCHAGDEDPTWTLTSFCIAFHCCSVEVPNLSFLSHHWSRPLMNQNPGVAFFPKHLSILAKDLLCFNSIFKFNGFYLHLPLSVRHH